MAVLDQVLRTPWWAVLINLDTFQIMDGSRCVLGQVLPIHGEDDSGYNLLVDFDINGKPTKRSLGGALMQEFDLNGLVQDELFEYVWQTPFGSAVGNVAWKKAIRARQVRLCGSVEAASEVRRLVATRYSAHALSTGKVRVEVKTPE